MIDKTVPPEQHAPVKPPIGLESSEQAQAAFAASPPSEDALRSYLREISQHPVLTMEEERSLTRLFRETGDQEAQHKLITANLRLVVKIASRFQNRSLKNLADLIQEGNLGLLRATALYDPYRGVKFSYYASYWIKAYIYKFILDNWRLVRIGNTETQRKLFFNLVKEKQKLRAMGLAIDHEILAQRLNVKETDIAEMEQCLESSDLSLQAPIDNGSDEVHLNFLSMDRPSVEDRLMEKEEKKILHQNLKKFRRRLNARERDILDMRLLAEKPLTLQELGEFHRVSRERIRQVEKRLLKRMRKFFESEVPEFAFRDYMVRESIAFDS
ncbi:MAG: RNA polymerase factor sigma-32 [Deltaproteobacteria bacterium]|nr:RNA polymerase factor sigma-32 [Deltaproteobacteria bacterium]